MAVSESARESRAAGKKGRGSRLRKARETIKKHWIIATIALLCVVLLVALLLWQLLKPKPKPPPPPPPIPVSVQPVKSGSIDVHLDALGTVTPVYTVTVASRVAGELTDVRYKEGQLVKTGELLATIDARPYQAVLTQAKGQLARDQASLKNAQADLDRYQNAFKEHAVPEQEVATQKATVAQDQASLQLDQGNVDAAQVNVDYTRIVSPIDGRVGLRSVDPGNIVQANGAGIATITQLQPITVIFTIAEDDLGDVVQQTQTGRTLPVQAFDRSKQNKIADGSLATIDNQINTTTGTVRAKATFDNSHNELFPNQFVNARLTVKTLTNVNLVPNVAIQRNNDAATVYVVQPDSTVKSQDVKIVSTDGDVSAVTGVNPNDQLVTDSFDKLQNGTKIKVRQPGDDKKDDKKKDDKSDKDKKNDNGAQSQS
jgi:membrane fusion protein, multidrug efflux system